jgi:hypothetical protein
MRGPWSCGDGLHSKRDPVIRDERPPLDGSMIGSARGGVNSAPPSRDGLSVLVRHRGWLWLRKSRMAPGRRATRGRVFTHLTASGRPSPIHRTSRRNAGWCWWSKLWHVVNSGTAVSAVFSYSNWTRTRWSAGRCRQSRCDWRRPATLRPSPARNCPWYRRPAACPSPADRCSGVEGPGWPGRRSRRINSS